MPRPRERKSPFELAAELRMMLCQALDGGDFALARRMLDLIEKLYEVGSDGPAEARRLLEKTTEEK